MINPSPSHSLPPHELTLIPIWPSLKSEWGLVLCSGLLYCMTESTRMSFKTLAKDQLYHNIHREILCWGLLYCIQFPNALILVHISLFCSGAKLPNITILLPVEKTQIICHKGDKTVNLAGRWGEVKLRACFMNLLVLESYNSWKP